MLCTPVDRAVDWALSPGLLRAAFSLILASDLCAISSNEFKKLFRCILSPLYLLSLQEDGVLLFYIILLKEGTSIAPEDGEDWDIELTECEDGATIHIY